MRILVLFFFVLLTTYSKAQSFNDVFDEKTEITWLGLDYTKVKIVSDVENWESTDPNQMFTAWNQLMIDEQEKNDMAKTLHRDKVKLALDVTIEHNRSLKIEDLFVGRLSDDYRLSLSEIKEIVKGYDYLGNTGIGVMFIVESLNKPSPKGSICVTFINLNTKEVLYSSRMASEPSGFGLRNFWASPIDRSMKTIQSSLYKKWSKEASRSK